jgi:periplasmic protein TonB
MLTAKSQAFSLGLHVVLLAFLLLAMSRSTRAPAQLVPPVHAIPLTFFHPRKPAESRGGGSNQTRLPAKSGTPPPTARRTFIPPTSSDHPPLALPITVTFDIPRINSRSNLGDPFSRLADGALGLHGRNGIGDHGCCQGIGESRSGPPGASASRDRGITPPQLVFKVEPEFSEEARKAKYQGVVVLAIDVDANGAVRNIRVRKSLGLGLDEKAVEAVSHWRFRPGILNGKPVVTEAVVQVNFQLL